jgi:hypothetical protein
MPGMQFQRQILARARRGDKNITPRDLYTSVYGDKASGELAKGQAYAKQMQAANNAGKNRWTNPKKSNDGKFTLPERNQTYIADSDLPNYTNMDNPVTITAKPWQSGHYSPLKNSVNVGREKELLSGAEARRVNGYPAHHPTVFTTPTMPHEFIHAATNGPMMKGRMLRPLSAQSALPTRGYGGYAGSSREEAERATISLQHDLFGLNGRRLETPKEAYDFFKRKGVYTANNEVSNKAFEQKIAPLNSEAQRTMRNARQKFHENPNIRSDPAYGSWLKTIPAYASVAGAAALPVALKGQFDGSAASPQIQGA